MKRRLLMATVAAIVIGIFSTTFFISCKKEQNVSATHDKNESSLSSEFTGDVSVSTQGFLIFPTFEDFELFGNFLASSTHSEVEDFLENIEFTSRAQALDLYSGTPNDPVEDDQQIDYALDANSMIQVGDIIMKPVSNNQYILAMTSSNLNTGSYNDMVSGSYNSASMNKFATNGPIDGEDTDMFTFMISTPTGHEETTPNNPPTSGAKFWGKSDTREHPVTNGAGGVLYTNCCYDYYMFWIKVTTHCEPC